MKRTHLLILFFGTVINTIWGQSIDTVKQKYWVVKFAPANLIDPINPSVQIGIERKININSSVQAEIGYILPSDLLYYRSGDSSVFPNYHGIKVRIEYRREVSACGDFINSFMKSIFSDTKGIYLASELLYTYNKYNSRQGYNKPSDSLTIIPDYIENVIIDRKVLGLNFKLGLQQRIGRFVFEGYVGLGVKYKIVKHYGRSNLNDEWTLNRHPNIYAGADMPGNYWTANLPFNIKVGYMF